MTRRHRHLRKFAILVYGRNFRLLFRTRGKEKVRLTGFYTWRCVRAYDPIEAERRAIDLIRKDRSLRENLRNPKGDPPLMYAEEKNEVQSFVPLRERGGAFVFFHGRGAGRPRRLTLARDPKIPIAVRRSLPERGARFVGAT